MTELSEYAAAKAAVWREIVRVAYRGDTNRQYSELSKADQRKVRAINDARQLGMTQEEIIGAGQSEILSRVARNRKKHSEPQRVLAWRVSRSLADAVMTSNASPDAEEALVSRLVRVCHLRTSDDFFEFLLSVFADVADKELRNLAGVVLEKKQKSPKRS